LRKLNPDQWGGTETAIQRLLDGLREHGVTPVVYCPRLAQDTEDPLSSSGCKVQRFRAFVPILGISAQRKRELISVGGNLMSFDLISSLWNEQDVSVIHAHTLGRIGGIALTIAKQRQVPFVVTIHGGVLDLPAQIQKNFQEAPSEGWEWGKFFGLLFQSHRLFRDADAIITCNENEAALLRKQHPDKRIVVQPHGVPLAIYQQDHQEAARAAFPQIANRRVLLTIGRIDPIKNQGWLLEQTPEILRRHPDALLVWVGACTHETYGAEIQSQIRKRGLENHVLLTGGLPPNDPRLIGLLQQAEVMIIPSLSETFGLVILEAWATGTMVLSSRTSGAAALLRHGQNGWFFDLEEPESLHQVLKEVLIRPEFSRSLVRRGAEAVNRDYNLHALAGRMKKLYEEVIEEKQCAT
jgi:glycosyltransferase involved in cell wall biosynthesis